MSCSVVQKLQNPFQIVCQLIIDEQEKKSINEEIQAYYDEIDQKKEVSFRNENRNQSKESRHNLFNPELRMGACHFSKKISYQNSISIHSFATYVTPKETIQSYYHLQAQEDLNQKISKIVYEMTKQYGEGQYDFSVELKFPELVASGYFTPCESENEKKQFTEQLNLFDYFFKDYKYFKEELK